MAGRPKPREDENGWKEAFSEERGLFVVHGKELECSKISSMR
jgi:hypothetical protein